MVFSSTIFIGFFLPVLIAVYFCIPKRFLPVRNIVLLVFSILFYGFGGVKYLGLLMISAIVFLAVYLLIHRPVAPQGSTSPVSLTGRPISELTVCPPYFWDTNSSRI